MVLVAAGVTIINWTATAELYDPASGTWTATGSLDTGRTDHAATLLQNGMFLVAGGFGRPKTDGSGAGPNFTPLASAELYNPASGTWTATGSLNRKRYRHTATLLQNGRVVLVAGGVGTNGRLLASAELGRGHR
jgi:hypothetical protein